MPGSASQLLKQYFILLSLILISGLGFSASVYGQTKKEVPLLDVITTLQEETPYRFLYRESLIRSVHVSVDLADPRIFESIRQQIKPYSLVLEVDSSRHQVLVLQNDQQVRERNPINIQGQVVNDVTGERLPFATLTWTEEGVPRGAIASSSGSFHLICKTANPFLQIRISHMGYETEQVTLAMPTDFDIRDLTVRMKPKTVIGSEIIITGTSHYKPKGLSLAGLVNTGSFSPMGESNAVRALQVLPSVGITTAMNEGLSIRGSAPDGLQVTLDGMTIFNQSHLFGLLDSFNDDAIQANSFYYDVTPANYHAPVGGTLSLLTRTGSQNNHQFNAGVSNTSVKVTAEGPIRAGRSSWLASVRHSYMNTLNWFNNVDLIEWGLDINRPRSVLGRDIVDLNAELVNPGEAKVQFFDLHGKVYHEYTDGNRLMASLYFGGNNTRQAAYRQARTFPNGISFQAEDVQTTNDWGNFISSLHYHNRLRMGVTSHSMIGISSYITEYSKDDFLYNRSTSAGNPDEISMFTYPFVNQSALNQFKIEQSFDVVFSNVRTIFGGSYQYLHGDYSENSFDRPGFLRRSQASQLDAFFQFDVFQFKPLTIQAGNRLYYYSAGNFVRWSPRIKLEIFPDSPLSFGAGFSKNHQFLHRISLANAVTSDIWILTYNGQLPTSVNHYSAGMYLQTLFNTYFQVEAYLKHYQNLWLHEINLQAFGNTFADTPWFFDNDGTGKGIEVMTRNELTPFLNFTQNYTLSQMILQNPYLFDGQPYLAPWDRKNSYSATLELDILRGLLTSLSWNFATGTPNRIVGSDNRGEGRLDNYNRLDLTMQYMKQISPGILEMKVSFFNLLNHHNTWYREYNPALNNSTTIPTLTTVVVDVYDLGFQPSFEVQFSF